MDKVLLIDGHNAIHRANVSFGPKLIHKICNESTHKSKCPTKLHCVCGSLWNIEEQFCYGDKYLIVYNFFRNLRPIIELFKPDKCFFILEGRPQFRYDLYAAYKANRIIKQGSVKQESKDKIFDAQKIIIDIIKLLPITICKAEKYEADDVIHTLCHFLQEEDITVLSNDSDYIQLLQLKYKNIKIYNPIKKDYMIAPPYPYVGWKSLNGDSSDNIPALVKPKQAINLITNPSLFAKFLSSEENRANFSINKQLIEFRLIEEKDLIIQEGVKDFDSIRNIFSEMKFESIINDNSWNKFTNTFNCLKF